MQYAPGQDALLSVTFTDSNGVPRDPDTISVDIFDPSGNLVVADGVPVQDGVGFWTYTFAIPVDAENGLWKIVWKVSFDGVPTTGEELFDVEPPGILVAPSQLMLHTALRSRVGEVSKLPADQEGSDTMFATSEISEILLLKANDLDAATLEAWERKAARLQRLIDFNESGTERNLSRKFIQAKQMVDYWYRVLASTAQVRSQALAGRVVGVPVRLRGDVPSAPILNGFSGIYERQFPTHRAFTMIPAILA